MFKEGENERMPRGVGGRGPANIMKHLKGISFPVNKEKIIALAKNGQGPDTTEVVDALSGIDAQVYYSSPEIMREIRKKE